MAMQRVVLCPAHQFSGTGQIGHITARGYLALDSAHDLDRVFFAVGHVQTIRNSNTGGVAGGTLADRFFHFT